MVHFLRSLQVLGAMLVLMGQFNLASAQNKDDILERAAEVADFLELLEHEQSLVRQMAIADGLQSDNRYIRDAAIESGLSSRDIMVRKEALAGVLRTKPVFMIEVPVQLEEKLAASSFAEWWSIARLEVTSEFFDPDLFEVRARSGSSSGHYNCVLRMDEVLCRRTSGSTTFELKPGVSGTITGVIDNGEQEMPIVIRNF